MIAFFPGQGSQYAGMGKDLYTNFPYLKELFQEAEEAAKTHLTRLCFDGPDSDLALTENTQPCLLLVSVAAFRCAEREFGFSPKLVMGHSLGEYSALVAAGAFPFATAIRWVRARGKAMQSAVPAGLGGMAAIMGLSDEAVTSLCKKITSDSDGSNSPESNWVEPANFNSPGQVVVSGRMEGLEAVKKLLAQASDQTSGETAAWRGGKFIPLTVSAPFHSRLMAPARKVMEELFASDSKKEKIIHDLKCPYIPNFTGRLATESSVVLEFLGEQIDHAVLWTQSVESALAQGFTSGVEFGPGKVLQGLVKRICKAKGSTFETTGVSDTASLKTLPAWLEAKKGTA